MRSPIAACIVGILTATTQLSGQARDELAPSCQKLHVTVEVLDSIDARLDRDDPEWGSTNGSRSATCGHAKVSDTSLVVVALAGGDERTGGLAFLSRDAATVLAVASYPAARELLAAGNRRIFFTYTYVRELLGAGQYESRYVVLCALSTRLWVPCLEIPRDRVEVVLATPVPMRLEEHDHAVVRSDSVYVTREVRYQVWGAAAAKAEHLGSVVFALPRLP